ncbi:ABC transporter ATP-binding protein [Cellulosimicrobium funkei]|nr:ABC transporter ATP-binding protein [Cellulosimicrobium funkei]
MTSPTSAPAIQAENLHKSYRGRKAVNGISLSVRPGEVMGVLGANGAGKTTTVEIIAGLRTPETGTVRVLGLDPQHDRGAVRQVLGVQLQQSYLHGALTVAELVDLYRSFYPDPVPAEELIDRVGLGPQRRIRFEKLSGGQQQRVSIALALAGRPRVVILDELTTGLDPRARRRLWSLVEQMRDDGVTVLLVSHAMDEVEHLCDRLVVLDVGRVITRGTPGEITSSTGTHSLEEAFLALTGRELDEDEDSSPVTSTTESEAH